MILAEHQICFGSYFYWFYSLLLTKYWSREITFRPYLCKRWRRTLPDASYSQRFKAWAWNNLVLVSLIGLFIVAYCVTLAYQALMGIGIYDNYTESSLFSSFTAYACENEVDCKYCHNSAYDSKHAGIPTTNDKELSQSNQER